MKNVLSLTWVDRWMQPVSLVYAALPCLIFMLGWLRPVFGVPLAVILALAVFLAARRSWKLAQDGTDTTGETPDPDPKTLWARYGVILVLVTTFVALSGIAGYSFQLREYDKHHAFFRDLTAGPWPLGYEATGPTNEPGMLLTYFNYYLPPALVGKVLGWNAMKHFTFFWALGGVLLAVLWYLKSVKRHSIAFAALFLFFGGIDILAEIIMNGWEHLMERSGSIDYWGFQYSIGPGARFTNGEFFIYGGNYTFLTDGPHHVIPAWILIFMLLYDAIYRRSCHAAGLYWALTPLCSAFVAVGMAPFVLLAFLTTRLKGAFSFANLVAAPLILLMSASFFLSNDGAYRKGWIWEFQDLTTTWPFLAMLYLVEFGLYVAVRPHINAEAFRPFRIWWYGAIACLLLLPFYRLGGNAELMAKGAVTALIVFQICLGVTLASARTCDERARCRPLIFLLILGAVATFGELMRGLDHGVNLQSQNWDNMRRIDELEPKAAAAQLFSNGDSFFWKTLAKPVNYFPPEPLVVVHTWEFASLDPGQWQWSFSQPAERTPQGARLRMSNNGPLARLNGVLFEAAEVGAVTLVVSVKKADQPQEAVRPTRLTLFWGRDRDVPPAGNNWIIGQSRREYFLPYGNGHIAWASQVNAWQSVIQGLQINIDFPASGNEAYDVTVEKIEFLARAKVSG